ncbi:hypothetical protein [Nocardioides sp. Soil796]|uniref:hypothetical protein n=1 Tax=Nocardioides sp. Soil796 TaxID=1736412 RepID=UPI00070F540D|nr:hypothetical protein [Nocardioides sp. Soil796]KRF16051.1 hypothetical protein ASH02_05470 [Nocardioides sp. Soil796]
MRVRTNLLTGLALLVAGVLIVLLSSGLDLELESTALMGAALGAVMALVPDRTPLARMTSFLGGFLAAWVGYLVRAALMPDTATGRAVALALVIALCVALVLITLNRLPLWGTLVGAAAMAGGYEASYALAPSEVVDTSMTAVTTILITVAVGFLAASLVAPVTKSSGNGGLRRQTRPSPGDDEVELNSMMENAR